MEHGAAPYEKDSANRQSYFVTLENDRGKRHTIWGIDLERAIDASGARLGDRIGLKHGGSDPRHHAAAILQAGQQRTMEALREQKTPELSISEKDRQRADMHAKREVDQFKAIAVKRQAGFAGYTDRNPDAWQALPAEKRERIERFNALSKERQAIELQKMQRTLADQYARDPRGLQRQRDQDRGHDNDRGYG